MYYLINVDVLIIHQDRQKSLEPHLIQPHVEKNAIIFIGSTLT